jgi:hypothetical protein
VFFLKQRTRLFTTTFLWQYIFIPALRRCTYLPRDPSNDCFVHQIIAMQYSSGEYRWILFYYKIPNMYRVQLTGV